MATPGSVPVTILDVARMMLEHRAESEALLAEGLPRPAQLARDIADVTEVEVRRRLRALRSREDYDAINEAVTFDPQVPTSPGEDPNMTRRPCLTVAGVQVYAYVDDDGVLTVSIDYDTADEAVFGDPSSRHGSAWKVPTRVNVGDMEVWSG
jgi:hypothetical protein